MTEKEKLLKAKIPCAETGIEVKKSICDICSPTCHCGLDVYVKDGEVIKIEGSKDHPHSQGALCPKGAANRQYLYREDRLHTPMKRVGPKGSGRFAEITWEEAYAEIAKNLNKIKAESGADSVAFVSGFSKWYRPIFKRFAYAFGSINYATESSCCFDSMVMAWKTTTGMFSVPDVAHAKVFLGWALNPYYSNHLTARDVQMYKEHGGKVIIVDPRVTPAVDKLADIHLQLRPGTDGALALGMAKIIIENGWQDQEFIDKHTYGYEDYAAYVKQWDLEKVARITGLNPDDIYRATEMFATNKPAAIQQSASPVSHHINGYQNYRALIALAGLTGNYDCPGGCFPMPPTYTIQSAGFPTLEEEFADEVKPESARPRISQGHYPVWDMFMDEFQMMDMTEQIMTGKPYPIRGVFALGLNDRMFPESGKTREALKKLDFLVASDLFLTEVVKLADIVLPACTSMERGEYKVYPGGFSMFTKPAIQPIYNSKSDVDMLCELAAYMDLDPMLSKGYEACVDWIIKPTGLTVEELKKHDTPIMTPSARPPVFGSMRENGFLTPTGKFEFKSSRIEKLPESLGFDALPTFKEPLADEEETYEYQLMTGARMSSTVHSRVHEVPWLRSFRRQPMIDINIHDAERLGIQRGDLVELYNKYGSVRALANPTDCILPGNLQLCHGYKEANANDLIGAKHLDPYTGFPGYKSAGCNMRKVQKEN